MALITSVDLAISARQDSAPDLGDNNARRALSMAYTLANGTAAGQADRLFADTRTLAASGTEDLDLAGVLTDVFGATLTFARIKALMFLAAVGNTNNVLISRPASNGWATFFSAANHSVILRPGAALMLAAGFADATGYGVTAATGDLITVTNSAGTTSVDYSIIIVGASA